MKVARDALFNMGRLQNKIMVFVDVLFFDFFKLRSLRFGDFAFFHAAERDDHDVLTRYSVVREEVANYRPMGKCLKVRRLTQSAAAQKASVCFVRIVFRLPLF